MKQQREDLRRLQTVMISLRFNMGDVRVFYNIQEAPLPTVFVVAVGKKVRNELWIGGERIEL